MSWFANGLREFRRFTDYRGRSTRADLVAFWLVTCIAGVALTLVALPLQYLFFPTFEVIRAAHLGFQAALVAPWAAIGARRLHDRGFAGWWLILFIPALVASFAKRYYLVIGDFDALFGGAQANLNLAGFLLALPVLILLFVPGQEGANRYGPNPRDGEPGEAA